jgi:hypothetical protein
VLQAAGAIYYYTNFNSKLPIKVKLVRANIIA